MAILVQAARTLRHVLGLTSANESWCLGSAGDLSGQLVLASVQKLSRPDVLNRLAGEHFDYAILDEVHHAGAVLFENSYESCFEHDLAA